MKRISSILIALLCISQGFAQFKVTANLNKTSPAHSMFGWAVSIDGDYAAISAPNESYNEITSGGAVYLFQKSGENWNLLQRLVSDDPHTMILFGLSLQIKNGLLAVGAPNDNGKSGTVYLYRLDNGIFKFSQKLQPTKPLTLLEFGVSVDIGNDYLLVGSGGSEDQSSASGSVYVFSNISGVFVEYAVIQSPNEDLDDLFASAVEIVSEDQFLVGAPRAHAQSDNSGAVYSYKKYEQGWVLSQKITSPQETSDGLFGCSVSYNSKRILVGAMQERTDSIISGAAYTYLLDEMGQFNLEKRIVPEDATDHDYFGFSVCLNPAYAMVSSPKYEHENQYGDRGCVDLFDLTDPDQRLVAKILPHDGLKDDHFGMSLSSDQTDLLIGSRLNDNAVANDGAGYFYRIQQLVGIDQSLISNHSSMILKLWPNPFLDESTLVFQLGRSTKVTLTIFDTKGQTVRRLVDQVLPSGLHQVSWDGTDAQGQPVPGGIYTCQIFADNSTESFLWIKANK